MPEKSNSVKQKTKTVCQTLLIFYISNKNLYHLLPNSDLSHFFAELETIDDDAEKSNIKFVKINDKRFGKSFGIKKFPALSFFRDKNIVLYEGDLKVTALLLQG